MSEPSPNLEDLERLQRDAVGYFLRAANPDNGLIADSSRDGSPCSIAATGLGLAAYVVGVERGFLPRREAAARTLTALRFFRDSPQGEEPDATGHRGFYYHFLDMKTGRRVWQCELSMIDTAILIAGVLTSGTYFRPQCFNPSFHTGDETDRGWLAPEHHGLDQGPVALMIENYRSGLLWRLMRECPAIVTGLRRAGFRNGWLRSSDR